MIGQYSNWFDRKRIEDLDGENVKTLSKEDRGSYLRCLADGICVGKFYRNTGPDHEYRVRVKQ